MLTYTEKSTQLALDATVAVLVLTNERFDDVEFLPLKPLLMTDADIAELRLRWPGRGLRSVGVIGLVGTEPECAFKEPLEAKVVVSLASAFNAYLQALFQESFAAQLEGFEIAELCRMWQMEDPRLA